MGKYDERTCLCTLNRIFGFKPRTGRALIEHFGSASAVFSEGNKNIRDALPYTDGTDRITDREYEMSEKELAGLGDARFIGFGENCYPAPLAECADAPLGLYVKGVTDAETLFQGREHVAVVGTRDISRYGIEWCERLVAAIADTESPPVIVSGLALGTDITAHRKALECGLGTIAVMATGIDRTYPRQHTADAARLCRTEGCALMTDYPPGTAPLPINFLRRNRIIAGLCRATVLIESRIKGGGMMTAGLAFSYDRDVYALPGRADDLRSSGCNTLIARKMAEPVIGTDTFVESLGLKRAPARKEAKEPYCHGMDKDVPEERTRLLSRILLEIKRNRGIEISSLADVAGLDYRTAAGYVGLLEADGLITVDMMQRCSINIR